MKKTYRGLLVGFELSDLSPCLLVFECQPSILFNQQVLQYGKKQQCFFSFSSLTESTVAYGRSSTRKLFLDWNEVCTVEASRMRISSGVMVRLFLENHKLGPTKNHVLRADDPPGLCF